MWCDCHMWGNSIHTATHVKFLHSSDQEFTTGLESGRGGRWGWLACGLDMWRDERISFVNWVQIWKWDFHNRMNYYWYYIKLSIINTRHLFKMTPPKMVKKRRDKEIKLLGSIGVEHRHFIMHGKKVVHNNRETIKFVLTILNGYNNITEIFSSRD